MDNKNWKKIKSETIFSSDFISVVRHTVIKPDGKQAFFYETTHKTNFFSVVIPLFSDETTLLVGQYRVAPGQYSWEFPMGSVVGLEPLQTAQRELLEETGFTAENWNQLGWFLIAPGHTAKRAYIFTATKLHEGIALPEENEFLDTKRVSLKKVKEMIIQKEIVDGPTIAAYFFYLQYAGKLDK
jgi:8-oxo-dGTP pyrophosphatase MutT (NUDIX family)